MELEDYFGFASMELEYYILEPLSCLCLCFFGFILWIYWIDIMGQTQTTPLSIMVCHFKEVEERASNLSAEVRKDRWRAFCSREWPTFNVRWPPEGTFDLPTIRRVRDIVSQPKEGHPGQLSYIVTWQDLVEDPPSWLRPFLPPHPPEPEPILALQEAEKRKEKRTTLPSAPAPPYPVLQGGTEEELIFPPPYHFHRMPERFDPALWQEADAVPGVPRGGVPGVPGDAVPGVPGGGVLGVASVPVPVGGPPLTRQRAQRELSVAAPDSTIKTLPLRAAGPPDANGNQPHIYWPFSTSDLYNWKAQNPKFSEKPGRLIDLLDSVLFTHQPTWDDCQQLLQVLFTTEERERILNEARKMVPGVDGNPTTNQAQIDASFPLTRPEWDFNTAEVAEKVFNNRESPEDRRARAMVAASDKQTRNLAKILLATTTESPEERTRRLRQLADGQERACR
ncbi:uncharacterized protein [Myotis yumanensis]|uniref:uncharacterized protein n=1 Tax=Myotis yumanensis TaxID=159337 RepID=UPI0038CFDC21